MDTNTALVIIGCVSAFLMVAFVAFVIWLDRNK